MFGDGQICSDSNRSFPVIPILGSWQLRCGDGFPLFFGLEELRADPLSLNKTLRLNSAFLEGFVSGHDF
jgi:hypothetical protein